MTTPNAPSVHRSGNERRWRPSTAQDDRATAPYVFDPLDLRFDGFTLDVAASAENAKCARYFTEADDGLAQAWADERVWCNPPYSDIRPWVEKAWSEWSASTPPQLIAMLLPATRTEQTWWQELVEPALRGRAPDFAVEFLPGRLRFLRPGQAAVGPGERPPFGCCLLIWGRS
jgi:phage N-6-adenine-methyltransferase